MLMKKKVLHNYLFLLLAVFCLIFTSCGKGDVSRLVDTLEPFASVTEAPKQNQESEEPDSGKEEDSGESSTSIVQRPKYSGKPYVTIDGNQPGFTEEEKKEAKKSFERYSELDSLGRCGTAYASVGQDLMPTKRRGSISGIKPTGWHTVKYDSVQGKYLYNRCHLIGYQLTAENANRKNLITGTRSMNAEGMLPFEDEVAKYVKKTDNHVLYRVTPIFEGKNLLADGVQMEAYSVEDKGHGVCFNVFVYNVQPGISIDYATGDSKEDS